MLLKRGASRLGGGREDVRRAAFAERRNALDERKQPGIFIDAAIKASQLANTAGG